MKQFRIIWLVLVIAGLGKVIFELGFKRHASPRSITRPTLDSVINVHGSPEQGLTICGKIFRRVKGGPPYYLAVPGMPLTLFAYEPSSGVKTLVVCDTNDCTFREIPAGKVVFGDQIGAWEATKGKMGDLVESVSSNRIILLHNGFRYLERSVLDLNDNTIRVIEVQSEFRPPITLDIQTNATAK